MMIVRNKRIGYLTTTPSPGHPNWPRTNHWTPPPQSSHLLLVRQIWFPPQIGHTLDHWWITWWSRESALSSRARVTSLYSHCEVHLPSAGNIHLNRTCRQFTRKRRRVHTRSSKLNLDVGWTMVIVDGDVGWWVVDFGWECWMLMADGGWWILDGNGEWHSMQTGQPLNWPCRRQFARLTLRRLLVFFSIRP